MSIGVRLRAAEVTRGRCAMRRQPGSMVITLAGRDPDRR
jgi:hypothetical protein